jgi:hypothetical protein
MSTTAPQPKVVARRRRTARIRRWVACSGVTLFVGLFAVTSSTGQASGTTSTTASATIVQSSTADTTASTASQSAAVDASPAPVTTSQS